VWAVSGSEDEVAQFNGTSWILHPPGHAGRLFEGPNGDIWSIGLNTINRFDGTTWQGSLSSSITVPIGSFDLTGAFVDSTNRLWLGTAQGDVVSWDGSTWTDHAHLGGVHVTEFAESPKGDIIVMTPFTSYKVTPQGLEDFYNAYNTGLTYHFIDGITAAPNGDMWFAGASGFGASATGVSRLYDDGRWDSHNFANGGSAPWPDWGNPSVNDVTHDAAGNILIATNSGGARWDGIAWETFTFAKSAIWAEHCEYVAVDSRGWLWFGHYQTGVSRFNGTDWQVYQVFNSPMLSNQVQCVEADDLGNVWIGTSGNLVKFDGAQFTAFDPTNSGLPSGWTNDVKVAPNGDVWVATADGVARFNGTNWSTFTESNSGIPAGYCTSLAIRANGEVWVGGFNTQSSANYGGVASFDGTTWTPYLFGTSPISHQQVSCLELDTDGNLWIGHAAGEGVNLVRFITCPGDIDHDGTVNIDDVLAVINAWGACTAPNNCPADIVKNGQVNIDDLLAVINAWGACDG
jgi:ligand-binding sensor domain-containing protein